MSEIFHKCVMNIYSFQQNLIKLIFQKKRNLKSKMKFENSEENQNENIKAAKRNIHH